MAYETLPLCGNLSVNGEGRLLFAGADTRKLAEKYGTPLYLMDEDRIRANIRLYKDAYRDLWPGEADVLYASKACSFKEVCRIASGEGIALDAVSLGELLTARGTMEARPFLVTGFSFRLVRSRSRRSVPQDPASRRRRARRVFRRDWRPRSAGPG